MSINLDEIHNYKGMYSNKWSFCREKTGEEDVLAMWIADMDFETAPAIKKVMLERAQTAIYGYAATNAEYDAAVIGWFTKRHGWKFTPDQILQTPGVVSALTIGVQAFSADGDGVLILTPVYHPFFRLIRHTKRKLVESALVETAGGYAVDFEDFEKKIIEQKPKVFILCNPHNPVGKVFSREELLQLGEICLRHKVIILSDEIHSDIVYRDAKHVPLATVAESIAQNTVVCTALSKTFNIAGLQNSNIIIPNPALRERFQAMQAYFGYPHISLFPVPVTIAAYQKGEGWLDEVLQYIEKNRDFALEYIKRNLPELKVFKPQGTYFLWLDFRAYGLTKEELEAFLLHEAKVWFNQGYIFGREGEGFARMNIACPRSLVEKALLRIKAATLNLKKRNVK
jgi:Bifunctional PLP-dependent enzyme with beta-cystathionase and maltose regulon repressor activities